MKSVRFLLIGFSLCLSLTITGCGLQALLGNKNKSSSAKGGNEGFIAVSLNEEDPNKLLITKGIEDLAKQEKVPVKYLDQSAAGKESPLKGAKVLIYQGGNASLLKSAETNKIPVIAVSQLPAGVKLEGIITPDQEKAGELMAQALISKVAEGQVVILQGDSGQAGLQERAAGIKAVLSKYPKITIQTITSPPDTESAAKQGLLDFLQKNPGKVQGILALTEKLAALTSEVLKQEQLEKKVVLVGGDASVPSLERMSSGTQIGDVDNSPYLQGVNAYQWAEKIIKKESLDVNDSITSEQGEVPAKIIQVKAVTPDNLAVTLKSYTKTIQSAEQAKKQTEQAAQSSQAKVQGKDQAQAKAKDQGQGQQKDSGSAKSNSLPPGVEKVTEQIKTETTREYLDAQGKVIGTEKTTNEQVKTVPPVMLKQQSEQQTNAKEQGAQGDQGDQSAKDKGSGGK